MGPGAGAVSLCVLSSSRSESGRPAGGKSEPGGGGGKVAASHPLPSLGWGFPGAGCGADGRAPLGERCPKEVLAPGGLSARRGLSDEDGPTYRPSSFPAAVTMGCQVSLASPLFLRPSSPSLLLPQDYAFVKSASFLPGPLPTPLQDKGPETKRGQLTCPKSRAGRWQSQGLNPQCPSRHTAPCGTCATMSKQPAELGRPDTGSSAESRGAFLPAPHTGCASL